MLLLTSNNKRYKIWKRKNKGISYSSIVNSSCRLNSSLCISFQRLKYKETTYFDAAKWGIKFENLSEPEKIGTSSVTGTAKIEETKSEEINGINVSLSTPGDKVVYTVDLVNEEQ